MNAHLSIGIAPVLALLVAGTLLPLDRQARASSDSLKVVSDSMTVLRTWAEERPATRAGGLLKRQLVRFPQEPGPQPEAWADTAHALLMIVASTSGAPPETATDLASRVLDRLKNSAVHDTVRLIRALGDAGQVALARRDRENAAQIFEEALQLTVARHGSGSRQEALALHDLASAEVDMSNFNAAEKHLLRETAIRDTLPTKNDVEHSDAVYLLSFLYRSTGRLPEARAYGERALAMREVSGKDSLKVAQSLTSLANLDRREGDYGRARPRLEEALRIRMHRLGPVHGDVALTQSIIGQNEWALGDRSRGLAYMRKAESTYVAAGLSRDPATLRCRSSVAFSYYLLGEIDSVGGVVDRMSESINLLLGKSVSATESNTLHIMADLLRMIGDVRRGRPVAEQLYRYELEHPFPDSLNVATAIRKLASVIADTRDPQSAQPLYRRAIEIYERAARPDTTELAATLQDLASTYGDQGKYKESSELLRRAIRLLEASSHPRMDYLAQATCNLATALRHLGGATEADSLYARAMAFCSKSESPGLCGLGDILQGRARLAYGSGDPSGARRWAEQYLDFAGHYFAPRGAPAAARMQQLIAAIEFLGDSTTTAGERSLAAAQDVNEYLRITLPSLSEREALNYAGIQRGTLTVPLELAARGKVPPKFAPRVWGELIRQRASVLDELARRTRVLRSIGDPVSDSLWRDLSHLRKRIASLYVRPVGDDSAAAYVLLDSLRRSSEAIERQLGKRSAPGWAELRLDLPTYSEVKAALPDSAALIAYVIAPPISALVEPDGREGGELFALILPHDTGTPMVLHLGSEAHALDLVRRWRATIGDGRDHSEEKAYRAAGESLRKELWDPVARLIPDVRTVFLVPDGCLSLVDFGALPFGKSGYLVESIPPLQYLSAERDLVSSGARREDRHALLAIGGVDYQNTEPFHPLRGWPEPDQRSRPVPPTQLDVAYGTGNLTRGGNHCVSDALQRLAPLPRTQTEIDRVAVSWNRAYRRSSVRTAKLIGREASEEAFKSLAPGATAIHVATHGFFLDDCERGQDPSPDRNGRGGPEVADAQTLLRAGLAFAGASEKGTVAPGAEDGYLSAAEIAALDLRSVSWIALSACETGVGQTLAGEGVLGLRRAFQVAGAGTLIMTLWPVGDRDAARVMESLYKARFERGMSVPAAMRHALLSALEYRRRIGASTHPAEWAGFIASGHVETTSPAQ